MYRRVGGVQNIALTSPTDSPPDWDLIDLINLDFTSSFATPCLTENPTQNPVKMKSNRTAPAILAIGSPPWMEDETKPVRSALESLRGVDFPTGISLESLLADRGSGLNTPPPLPLLSDLSDFIPNEEKTPSPGVGIKEEQGSERFSGFGDTSGHSPLRDLSIENTVNLKEIFSLQNFDSNSVGLLGDLNPDPQLYLEEDKKQQLAAENNHQQKQQYEQLLTADTAAAYSSSLLYLPAACHEELVEDSATTDDKKQLLPLSPNNFGDGCQSSDIITITEEDFNRLAGSLVGSDLDLIQGRPGSDLDLVQEPGSELDISNSGEGDLDLIQEANHVLEGYSPINVKPVNQQKTQRPSGPRFEPGRWEPVALQSSGSKRNERKSSSGGGSSRKRRIASLDKESEEYKDKRARNNESVRKSRDKAKQRQEETEIRLLDLSTENKRLQDRVESLEKELGILRGLFSSSQQR